jgi:hypothetical protein
MFSKSCKHSSLFISQLLLHYSTMNCTIYLLSGIFF